MIENAKGPATPGKARPNYQSAAEGYDERHGDPISSARFDVIEAPLRRLCRSGLRVVELGCGTGRFLSQVEGDRFGVDLSPAMLRKARHRGLAVAVADAHRLPLDSGSVDVIAAPKGVFRYLDYRQGFVECARILRPGGRLGLHQYAARTWSPRRFWRLPPPDSPLHVTQLEELLEPAASAGLSIEAIHRFRSIRVPPYAISLPRWLRGPLWSHVVAIFRRRDEQTSPDSH